MSKYFLDVTASGQVVAYEASSKQVPLAALVDKVKIYTKQKFQYDSRNFRYSLYARQGEVVITIHCDLLKWQIPLDFNKEANSFFLNTGNKMQDVYMKDVTLVVYQTEKQGGCRVDISDNQGRIPCLTNIYDYGQICTGGLVIDKIPSPTSIIALLEAAPGNSDISWSGQILLTEEKGLFVTNMGHQGRVKPDTKAFIEDYVS